MQYGYAAACAAHETGEHGWERAERLGAVRDALAEHGVEYEEPAAATETDVEAVHDADFVSAIRSFCADGGGDWGNHTFCVEATWDAALASAGLAIWAAREALEDGAPTPFALGRPPGHHATAADAMGFCVFNNAAVAAQRVLDDGLVDRVAILDWDVHHGNGTQDIFYDRSDVSYLSLHDQGLYPCTGGVEDAGVDAGAGTTVNVPLPPGSGDPDYAAALDRVVAPAIREYGPDLLLVSAGFDLHGDDAVSRTTVTTDGIGHLAARTRDLAETVGAGLGFVLEGGYHLESLGASVSTLHRVFEGETPSAPTGTPGAAVSDRLDAIAGRLG